MEQSPASHYDHSTEDTAAVQVYDEDTEMQQGVRGLEVVDDMHNSKNSVNISKNAPVSCSACVHIPTVKYEVSANALRLWSEVNSRQDRLKALDEIRVLANFFFAARSYADAFDLYFIIWTELGPSSLDHKLAAALDCARSSATPPQDSCVEAILHHLLSAFTGQVISSRSRQVISLRTGQSILLRTRKALLPEDILHSFLGDLYVKLKREPNAGVHTGKAMLHLDNHKRYIVEQGYPNHRHVVAALESQIVTRQKYVSQAIGYNVTTVSIDHISKRLATELQEIALLEKLLAWCAETINENARGMNAFRSVLPKQPIERQGFLCRALLCYLIERWLDERQRLSSAQDATNRRDIVSPPEALSAVAIIIVHDCQDQTTLHIPSGRQPSSGILSSALLKNIKQLIKLKSSYRSFSEIYMSLMAASGEARRQPLDHKSRTMLCQFMMNIAPTSLVNRHLPSRGVGSHNSLIPSPDLFREFEIRPASWSNRLYSPRSSFSSGLNSIRATATKSMMNSVLSLAKRQSGVSVTTMSTASYRSSWSFGAGTGLPSAPSVLSDREVMDSLIGIIHGEPRDEEMAGV